MSGSNFTEGGCRTPPPQCCTGSKKPSAFGLTLVLYGKHSTINLQQVHDNDVTISYLYNRSRTFATCSQQFTHMKTPLRQVQNNPNSITTRSQQTYSSYPTLLPDCSLYAKCWNLIGWIMKRGPFIHFRADGPDHLYHFRSKLKRRIFGKMVEKLSTEVVKS